jgi:5'-3' exonuclease
MGVPGYFKTLIKKNPELVYFNSKEENEYLFMDYNNIIHTAYQEYLKKMEGKLDKKTKAVIEKEIIKFVIEKTIYIVTMIVKPSKLLFIAMDGTPPRGKMEQQRLRRYKSVLDSSIKAELKKKHGLDSKIYFDSNNISPGTLFMERLSKALQAVIKAKKFNVNKKFKVILSDTSVVGEGEHKIIPYIKEHLKDKCNICIYGDDADLIFLSMTLLDKDHRIKIMKSQSLEETNFEEMGLAYLDISKTSEVFFEYIGVEHAEKIRILYDYIFIMIIFGDDFVKKLPGLNMRFHHDMILKLYKTHFHKHKKHLIKLKHNKFSINKAFLLDFLSELSKMEDKLLKDEQKNLHRDCKKPFNNRLHLSGYKLDLAIQEKSLFCQKENMFYNDYKDEFNKINYFADKHVWKKQYYNYFFPIQDVNYNKARSDICQAFLKSWKYTFEYYLAGTPPSWSSYYPYRVAPFISDLITNLRFPNSNMNSIEFVKSQPYTPLQQLLIIMPPQMKASLPKECVKIMSNKDLKKYFPTFFRLDALAGKIYIYSEPLLDEINDTEILEALAKVTEKLTNAEKNRNTLNEEKEFEFK